MDNNAGIFLFFHRKKRVSRQQWPNTFLEMHIGARSLFVLFSLVTSVSFIVIYWDAQTVKYNDDELDAL